MWQPRSALHLDIHGQLGDSEPPSSCAPVGVTNPHGLLIHLLAQVHEGL